MLDNIFLGQFTNCLIHFTESTIQIKPYGKVMPPKDDCIKYESFYDVYKAVTPKVPFYECTSLIN